MDMGHCRIERVENFYYGLPDRREEATGVNRDGTSRSRDERRSRRRSRSVGRASQPSELPSGTPIQQQSQPGQNRGHTTSYISPFDDRYAVDDEEYASGDEKSSDESYISAPTHITMAGRGHRGEGDGGGRIYRDVEAELLVRNREGASSERGNGRGDEGSSAANQQPRSSVLTTELSERERRPLVYHSHPLAAAAPPPVPYHSRPILSGMTSQQQQPERPAATPTAASRDRLPRRAAPHAQSRDAPPAYPTDDMRGLLERQKDHDCVSRGTKAPEEPRIGNAYPTSSGRQERRVSLTDDSSDPRNPQLPVSSHRHRPSSSLSATPQRQSQQQGQERTQRRHSTAAAAPVPQERLHSERRVRFDDSAAAISRTNSHKTNTGPTRREADAGAPATNTGSGSRARGNDVVGQDDRQRATELSGVEPPAYTREAEVVATGGSNNNNNEKAGSGRVVYHDDDKWKNKYKGRNIAWFWFLGIEVVPDKKGKKKGRW